MYIKNLISPYEIKKDDNNKCSRIFRPWDSESAEKKCKDNSQDCTVSTTTHETEELICIPEERLVKTEVVCNSNGTEKCCSSSFLETLDSTCFPEKRKLPTTNTYALSSCNNLKLNLCRKTELDKLSSTHLVPQPSQHLQDPMFQKQYQQHLVTSDKLLPTSPLPMDFIPDPYNPLCPELMQTNLAQHLGLPPNDPLLLESMAQGYALEEYARVLNQEQQAKLLAAKKQRPKKYKCPHCDVGFSNNGQLKGHIRIHTGERPYKCDDKDCGKTFTRNEELTRHKRIHSGLRPFPCTHCGKRFGRKDHLKKHSRTHFQPRGLYAVPVVLPFEAWATGQTNGYPFFPMMY